MTRDDTRERELADQLEASAALAFRVAYAVLRHRQDAEDVAPETLAKAIRSFWALRDRDRFEAWLVRITGAGPWTAAGRRPGAIMASRRPPTRRPPSPQRTWPPPGRQKARCLLR